MHHIVFQREQQRYIKEKKLRIEASKAKMDMERRLQEYQTTLQKYRVLVVFIFIFSASLCKSYAQFVRSAVPTKGDCKII